MSEPGFDPRDGVKRLWVGRWLEELLAWLHVPADLWPVKTSYPPPPGPLASTNFVGGFDPRLADAMNGAQSTYSGSVVVTSLPQALVASVLAPAGFELAETTVAGATAHPVVFLIGRQDDPFGLRLGKMGLPETYVIPEAVPYNELILLIPYAVRTQGTARWHNFAIRMYLDNLPPIAIGNFSYAYNKAWGDFDYDLFGMPTAVRVGGHQFFEADVQGSGVVVSADETPSPLAGFDDLKQIFQMPLVGQMPFFGPWPAGPICSYFEWDFTNATVESALSQHTFWHSFRDGMQGWPALGPLASAAHGAFKLDKVRWRLSLELPPQPASQPPICRF